MPLETAYSETALPDVTIKQVHFHSFKLVGLRWL